MEIKNKSLPEQNVELRRELGTIDATSIVVGTVMGSGIFLIPAVIATEVSSPKIVFAIWLVGGTLSLFGALSVAELGSIYPGAGGLYVYLREVYGSLPAFLYGWGLLTMIHSGSIAAIALGFGVYSSHSLALGKIGQKIFTILCIALLSAVNCFGIRLGKVVQNSLSAIKLTGIGTMILLLFIYSSKVRVLGASLHIPISGTSWLSVGTATVAVLWAYEGWHVVSFAAGEMRRPQITLPRSLGIGTAMIIFIYLLANIGYYALLTPGEIRSSPALAAAAIGKCLGTGAGQLISALILISILGSLNGMITTGPRVYYAMARDGLFFSALGRTSSKYNTPIIALALQGLWAIALSLSGSYQQLLTDVIFTAWIFYGLTVGGVIVLRKTNPILVRPYRVPGYPWIPLLFCLAAAGISVSTIVKSPVRSVLGIGLILTGVPVYLLFRRHSGTPIEKLELARRS